MIRSLTCLAALLLFPALARADGGLADGLPPPLAQTGCPDPATASLARAGEAVRAAYLPLQPLVRESVAGVSLHDDPRAIDIVRRSLGEKPPPSWSKAAGCGNSICALKAMLGGTNDAWEAALWMLEIGAHGLVASVDQSPWSDGKLSLWNAVELRSIAFTLHDLPKALLARASNLKALRRAPDGDALAGGANALSERGEQRLGGGGSIGLRDVVWKMEPQQRREVLAHEIGHHLDYAEEKAQHRKYALSHGDEWLGIGGWSTSGDRDAPGGFHRQPVGEDPWTAGSWPSEEFANAIAEYRYQGRLLRAESPKAYAYAGRFFDRDFLRATPDAELDAQIAQAGGRLALFRGCAEMVQRTFEKGDGGPANLALAHEKPDGSIESATWDRWSFVAHSPCVAMALETLKALPGFAALACRRDPDELYVRLADRLQEIEAGVLEGSRALLAARPAGAVDACLAKQDLRPDCLAGPRGQELAREQAQRLAAEFAPGKKDAEAEAMLARAILHESPLAPPDDALLARVPLLGDGPETLAACAGGAVSVTANGKGEWRFWVKVPPKDEVRGFAEPIRTAACTRDYGAMLAAHGLQLEPAAVEPFSRGAKNAAFPLGQELVKRVLGGWDELRAACGIAPASKLSPEQQPCAVRWISAHLDGLVPESARQPLAQKLAASLKGP